MNDDPTTRNPFGRLDPADENITRAAMYGSFRTQAIYVAAKLGLADRLSLGPRSAEELARATDVNPMMLKRVLRFLASYRIFVELPDDRFALNAAAEYLQSGHPRSLRPSAVRAGEQLWERSALLLEAVRTGVTPHDEVVGQGFFERVDAEGKSAAFAARMMSSTGGLGLNLAALDLFTGARVVVDIGGGNGSVLLPLLQRLPHLQAIIFDKPSVAESAGRAIVASGAGGRCTFASGDFFESVPGGGDIYLLSWILHDWDDERAARILAVCRAAMKQHARLLLLEVIMPAPGKVKIDAGGSAIDPFLIDMQMLLLTGGRERTLKEYTELLATVGLEINAITKTDSARGVSFLEARPR